ncbi:hypothetical protein B0J13DRAFT_447691 [Dactylonectria estremocensis]|uniref:Rhodopsin domain-containing protein n=1 Tax=Dactylonectria estremocensis TaxID=1079267 RepID=A0A9P9ELQ7_9HYPO|nr:hypothetical protein B0J13DRAFT_447691 [Dactylonectria estremocensis]
MTSTANLTGEEIADIAYAQSSIKPDGFGLAIEVLIYVFTILCTIIVGLRIWVRTFRLESRQWKVNDWLAVLGFLPFIPASVLGVLSIRYGIGARDSFLDKFPLQEFLRVRGREYLLYYELTYYASSSITKFSIAFMILQICVQKKYVYVMYSIMGLMAVTSFGCVIWLFTNCIPFAANWNVKLGHCKSANGFLIISYVGTSVQVVSDWACAITPFFIVWSLQMHRRTKISVVGVLSLGVLASIAALMRIVSYKYIDISKYPDDYMVSEGRLLLWSVFESSFAIIACSLPSLKLFTKCLNGSTNRSTGLTPRSRLNLRGDTPLPLNPHAHTRTTVSGKAKWDRLHDDDSSGRHIIQETEIRVEVGSHKSDVSLSELNVSGRKADGMV